MALEVKGGFNEIIQVRKGVSGCKYLLNKDIIFILLEGVQIQVMIPNKFSGHLVHLYRTHKFNTMDSEAMFKGDVNAGQGPVPRPGPSGRPLVPAAEGTLSNSCLALSRALQTSS